MDVSQIRTAEEHRFDKAVKIPATAYEGWVYWEDHGDNEGFFASMKELQKYCEREEIAPPAYVWACNPMGLSIRASTVIDDALADHHENAGTAISREARDELQALLDVWCAKQTVQTWFEDSTRAVVLDQSPPGKSPSTT